MKKFWSIAILFLVVLFMSACADETTTGNEDNNNNSPDTNEVMNNDADNEENEAVNDNASNEQDENGDAEEATSGTVSGLTTLQMTEKITEEWKNTAHAATDNALAYAGMRDSCQPCHSGNGFESHMSEEPFSPESEEEEGAIDNVPRTMDCATCHSGAGKEMLETGTTEGYVPFVEGAWEVGEETALCISCHNGRRDTSDLFAQWESGDEERSTDYPHYDAGALFSGKGGMEYPDAEYRNSEGHQIVGCIGCHMPETEEGYVSHTFAMEEEYLDVSCDNCHGDTSDFAVGGNLQAELDELLDELHEAAVESVDGAVAVGMSRMTFPYEDENGEQVDLDNVSLEAFVAAYNYYLIRDDKSGGAHNPRYAKSLLEESLYRLQQAE